MGISHMAKKSFVAFSMSVLLAASQADAQTLVGSLLLERSTTDGIYDDTGSPHFTIDDGNGDVLTRGVNGMNGGHAEESIGEVQGTFNYLSSNGASEASAVNYDGGNIRNFTNNTVFVNVNRFPNNLGVQGGLLTWDFDLSAYLAEKTVGSGPGESSFSLDVFWDGRRGQRGAGSPQDGPFYISVNDGSLNLDATDISTLTPTQYFANSLVTDRKEADILGDGVVGGDDYLKMQLETDRGAGIPRWQEQYGLTSTPNPNYAQIGVLPAEAAVSTDDPSGIQGTRISFDITDFIANSTDKVIRIAYLETEFRGDVNFILDTGIVETINPSLSAVPEPSSLMIGLLSLSGLCGLRRVRQFQENLIS